MANGFRKRFSNLRSRVKSNVSALGGAVQRRAQSNLQRDIQRGQAIKSRRLGQTGFSAGLAGGSAPLSRQQRLQQSATPLATGIGSGRRPSGPRATAPAAPIQVAGAAPTPTPQPTPTPERFTQGFAQPDTTGAVQEAVQERITKDPTLREKVGESMAKRAPSPELERQQAEAREFREQTRAVTQRLAEAQALSPTEQALQRQIAQETTGFEQAIAGEEGLGRGRTTQLVRGRQALLGEQRDIRLGGLGRALEAETGIREGQAAAAQAELTGLATERGLDLQEQELAFKISDRARVEEVKGLVAGAEGETFAQKYENLAMQGLVGFNELPDAVQESLLASPTAPEPVKLGEGDRLVNPETGAVIASIPKESAFATEGLTSFQIQDAISKGYVKPSELELYKSVISGGAVPPPINDSFVSDVEGAQAAQEVLNLATSLLNDPALAAATGPIGQFLPSLQTITGGTTDFSADLERLQNLLTLDNLDLMSGVLSETDIKILQGAATSLKKGLTTDKFREELQRIIGASPALTPLKQSYESLGITDASFDEALEQFGVEGLQQIIDSQGGGFRREGVSLNRPQRNQNPGNVKSGGVADKFALTDASGRPVTDEVGHLVFPNAQAGFQGLQADLKAKITGRSRVVKSPNPTIAEVGRAFAEDPNWAAGVARVLGVNVNSKARSVPFDQLVQAVARQEGFFA